MLRPAFALVAALALPPAVLAQATTSLADRTTVQCGGIGRESQERMVIASDRRDMMLTFASEQGTYLADVNVTITTPTGDILVRRHCGGPLMLVDLPVTGTVQVEASYRGQTQRKPVTIGKQTARVAFVWNVS